MQRINIKCLYSRMISKIVLLMNNFNNKQKENKYRKTIKDRRKKVAN